MAENNQGIAVTQRELPSKKDELEAVPFPEGIKLYVYEKCSLNARNHLGGTAPEQVRFQVKRWRELLA